DAALFANAEHNLEGNLMSAPVRVFAALQRQAKGRIAVDFNWLRFLGLAKRVGVPGADLRLQATGKGEAWLAETAKGRLKVVLDHFRTPSENKTHLPTRTRPVALDNG